MLGAKLKEKTQKNTYSEKWKILIRAMISYDFLYEIIRFTAHQRIRNLFLQVVRSTLLQFSLGEALRENPELLRNLWCR